MTAVGLPYADSTRTSIDMLIIVLASLSILIMLTCILHHLVLLSKSFTQDCTVPRMFFAHAIVCILAFAIFSGYGIASRIDLFLWIYPNILVVAPIGSLLVMMSIGKCLNVSQTGMVLVGLCLATTVIEVIVFILCAIAVPSPLISSPPSIIQIVFGIIAWLLLLIPMSYSMIAFCAPRYSSSLHAHSFPFSPGSNDVIASTCNMICAVRILIVVILAMLNLGTLTDWITLVYYILVMVDSVLTFAIVLFIANQKKNLLVGGPIQSGEHEDLIMLRTANPETGAYPAIVSVDEAQDHITHLASPSKLGFTSSGSSPTHQNRMFFPLSR